MAIITTKIKIKYSIATGTPVALERGEIAYSENSNKFFIGTDGGSIHEIGGKFYTDLLDHSNGVLTANSAILVDINKKVDNLRVDNIDIDGNTISTTNNSGNLILSPNGSGTVNAPNIKINGGTTITEFSNDTTFATASNNQIVSSLAIKSYIQEVLQGLDSKASVRLASTANIDLSSEVDTGAIDSVTLADDDRILLKDQTDPIENGIYVIVSAIDPSTWTRATDFDEDDEVTSGAYVFVEEGTLYGNTGWVVTSPNAITVDTDDIEWTIFSRAADYTAGTGLSLTGTEFAIVTDEVTYDNTGTTLDSTNVQDAISELDEEKASSVAGGFKWVYSNNTTMGDPSTGNLRLNNASLSSVTSVALSALLGETGNPDASDYIVTWDDSTNTTIKGHLIIRDNTNASFFAIYTVTSVTDNSTWLECSVSYVDHNGSLSNGDNLYVSFIRAGDKGIDGAGDVSGPVSSTNNAITLWDGTDASTVKNSNVTIDGSGNITTSGAFNGDVAYNNATSGLTALNLQDAVDEVVAEKLDNILEDTSPQFGGNVDVNGYEIISTSNGNIVVSPNGNGEFQVNSHIDLQAANTIRMDINALGDLGGGTDDIDLNDGRTVTATVSTATQTFTFSNPLSTSHSDAFDIYLTNGGSQTVNWPASVDWAGGTAPTLTASGVDHLVFTTTDGGTTWYGYVAGLDMS